jgi:hypothetical protein
VVPVELAIIAWVRNLFMDTPLISAAVQVVIGGLRVFGTGVLIGSFRPKIEQHLAGCVNCCLINRPAGQAR